MLCERDSYIMYQNLSVLDYDVRKEVKAKFPNNITNEPEMSEFDSAFLCGLIEKYRPQKVLEVGVAAGGTTAIILQKLAKCGLSASMFSCDLNELFYQNIKINGKEVETGFLAQSFIEKSNVKHVFYRGNYLPAYLDSIGKNIDFVVLDTVHFLPGEILDFLAVLPYLSKNAIVVLHDIRFNLNNARSSDGMATNALFASVVADKILNFGYEKSDVSKCPNIGAFIVNEDTRKYILNVFQSLYLPWYYEIDNNQRNIYLGIYKRHYEKELVDVFTDAVEAQNRLISTKSTLVRTTFRLIRNGNPFFAGAYNVYRKIKNCIV